MGAPCCSGWMTKTNKMAVRPREHASRPAPRRARASVVSALRDWRRRQRRQPAEIDAQVAHPPLESVLQPIERRQQTTYLDERLDAFLPDYVEAPQTADFGRTLW